MSNVENLPPHVLRGVSKEIVALSQEPPEGIQLHLNYDDLTDIQATIAGPGNESGSYKNDFAWDYVWSTVGISGFDG